MEDAVTGQIFETGKLLAVGPPTTTPPDQNVARTLESGSLDQRACTCVYCRKRGIQNQTTPEYRQANGIPDDLHALR